MVSRAHVVGAGPECVLGAAAVIASGSGGDQKVVGWASRRRGCHFADAPSPCLLKHLLQGRGDCSRMTVSPTARLGGRLPPDDKRRPFRALLPPRVRPAAADSTVILLAPSRLSSKHLNRDGREGVTRMTELSTSRYCRDCHSVCWRPPRPSAGVSIGMDEGGVSRVTPTLSPWVGLTSRCCRARRRAKSPTTTCTRLGWCSP